MSRRGGHRRAAAVAIAAGLVLCAVGCSPATSAGPLAGPRAHAGDVEICAPTTPGSATFFGEMLRNTGDEAAVIESVTGSGPGVGAVEFSVDTEGPSRGEFFGTMHWPAGDEAIGGEDAVVARMVEPEGARVDAGETAMLYLTITPASPTDDATVTRIEVTYGSAWHTYTEVIEVAYRLHPGESCEEPGATAAQDLANALGVEVYAPTDTLWAYPSGELVVGPSPTLPTGGWVSKFPGGSS